MPRTKASEKTSEAAALLESIEAVRSELRTLRSGQLKLFKAVYDLRHELRHAVDNRAEQLEALLKASHGELNERLDQVLGAFDDHSQRLDDLEQDFDDVFDANS